MKRIIAGLVALYSAVNGLIMLIDGPNWYIRVPGVPETGPYNGHFVQDIGVAFSPPAWPSPRRRGGFGTGRPVPPAQHSLPATP